MTPPAGPATRRRAVVGVLAALAVPLALVAAGELVLRATGFERLLVGAVSKRLYPPGLFSGTRLWDPALGWRLAPGAALPDGIGRIDAEGFVGRELWRRKVPGTVRILTLGDSVTYGVWACGPRTMCRERPWTTALELRLWTRSRSDRFEVVNAGVYGYSTRQGLRYFRLRLGDLAPDVVTVMFGWNDHGARTGREPSDPDSATARAVVDAAYGLATFRTALGLLTWAVGGMSGGWEIPDTYEPRVAVAEFTTNLERLVALGRARGAHVVLVTEPAGPLTEPYRTGAVPAPWAVFRLPDYAALRATHDGYMAAMRDVAARAAVPLVDAAARFAERDTATLFDPHDMIHPNAAGSALLAELIHAQLVMLGVAPP